MYKSFTKNIEKNVLRMVSSMWLLSDWLKETVGGVHLFVDLMHLNRSVLKSCEGIYKCTGTDSQINARQSCVCSIKKHFKYIYLFANLFF